MNKINRPSTLCLVLLSIGFQTACDAQTEVDSSAAQTSPVELHARQPAALANGSAKREPSEASTSRASHAQVQFAYPHDGCAYPYSPTDFCDATHTKAYEHALAQTPGNFSEGLILLAIETRPEYHQKSLVVLEPETGVVWPFPFDAYSGPLDAEGTPSGDGKLEFSLHTNRVCIEGALLVYRTLEQGRFCFTFSEGRFEGHPTQYSQDSG